MELKFGQSPIKCYPNYGGLFGIIDANTKEYLPWIYNYFIQMCVPDDIRMGFRADFCVPRLLKSIPWLNAEKMNRIFIMDKWGSITNFIIDAANHGRFVYTMLDIFYDHNYGSPVHWLHEHLFTGYDLERKQFIYYDNINGKYRKLPVYFK